MVNGSKSVYEIFESVLCGKCNGAKRFACWSGIAGGICFSCNGAGHKFTKHGKKNYEAWRAAVDALVVKPVSSVKVGDYVQLSDFRKYYKVIAISDPEVIGWHETKDEAGNVARKEMLSLTIQFDRQIATSPCPGFSFKSDSYGVDSGITVRIHPGADKMPKAEDFVTEKKARKAKQEAA